MFTFMLLALAGLAIAAPAPDPRLVGDHDATFEEPGVNAPGPYDALNFTYQYPVACLSYCPMRPYSFPARVTYDQQAPMRLGASYPGSKVAAFDMHASAFGCLANKSTIYYGRQMFQDVPVNCTIKARGFRGDGVAPEPPAVTQDFTYVPVVFESYPLYNPSANMVLFNFSKTFAGIRTVTFEPYVNKDTGPIAGGPYGYADSVMYRVYNFTL